VFLDILAPEIFGWKEKSMIRQKEIEEKEAAKAAIQPARGRHGAPNASGIDKNRWDV
jgi:hypothetical protein